MSRIFLDVLAGKAVSPAPLWLMRQAGRYLPEYRELRAQKGGFLDLCYDADAACEITLQPIRRFGFDAAILFSDILIVPHAIGQKLSFVENEGPRLAPPLFDAALDSLTPAPDHLAKIWQTVAKVRAGLDSDKDSDKALIGFCGSPWTVATYMIAGQGSRDQAPARLLAYQDDSRMTAIIERIIAVSIDYLSGQVKAGADALMLFDSWSGSLPPAEFEKWVIAPTQKIVSSIKALHPDVPIIGFPRGAGVKAPAYARETGVNALGLDEATDIGWVVPQLPDHLAVQGNIDPLALKAGGRALDAALDRLLDVMEGRPHIVNLGHGIDRFTPIAHVKQLRDRLREGRGRT